MLLTERLSKDCHLIWAGKTVDIEAHERSFKNTGRGPIADILMVWLKRVLQLVGPIRYPLQAEKKMLTETLIHFTPQHSLGLVTFPDWFSKEHDPHIPAS